MKRTEKANVPAAGWAYLIAQAHAKQPGRAILAVCATGMQPETLVDSLEALGARAMVLPGWDVQPYDRDSAGAVVQGQRLAVLQRWQGADGKTEMPVVVTTLPALGVKVAPDVPAELVLQAGDEADPDAVMQQLVTLGYRREDVVQEPGVFARRGGVLDVWPAARPEPVRVEWFDVEIEQLRAFDPSTQRALIHDGGSESGKAEMLTQVVIGPAAEVVITPAMQATFRQQYREAFPDGGDDEVYRLVSEGLSHGSTGQMLPLFYDQPLPSVLDALPETALVVLGDEVDSMAALWGETVQESYRSRKETGVVDGVGLRAIAPERLYLWGDALTGELDTFEQLVLHRFEAPGAAPGKVRGHDWLGATAKSAGGNRVQAVGLAAKEIADRYAQGWGVVVSAASAGGLAHLLKALEHEGMPVAQPAEDFGQALGRVKVGKAQSKVPPKIQAIVSALPHGFTDADAKLLVVADADVFGEKIGATAGPRRRKKTPEEMIAHFSELRENDYVVHETHGIGQFAGLVTMKIPASGAQKEITQDLIKLLYADGDRLFVPVESLDILSRYKGSETGTVTLDKLGTGGWEVRKERIKEDLMAMADELIDTAAQRQLVDRTPPLDASVREDALYDGFCEGFPYVLTDDQASVMADVEADLSAGHPMDRLVVGDVGFGKTEVALRAAFLVAASGRQVAVVCPTTLLARQHLDVFQQRFAGFPMQVAGLSRLVKAGDAKAVRAGLADGTVDVVVGTHAVLNKDIRFKNLGLVVIDEEQRFGVAHKERLKQLKSGAQVAEETAETTEGAPAKKRPDIRAIDVLTLTATPIPRTLQMAVGGVRGLSLITTPPVDRLAVQSHVLAWDNKTLKEAIQRELQRGGQVYVVAPHIEDLPGLADSLISLVPAARVGIAHGQMGEGELDAVMTGFYAGELNILLATTIIESGIDVPRANTLIVYRADRFGLAQLYQLRGRVGRSKVRAFAYFLLPDGPLGGDAARRLQILQRLEGLGAGFTLASYDMDLRGFGNLLGKQQSGHIRDIGFELYAKMLKEAVETRQRQRAARAARKRGEAYQPEPQQLERGQVSLKLGVTYLIPDDYVPDVATRLQLYRRLAGVSDEAGLQEFRDELKDRFGTLPDEVGCLLQVMSLRNRAAALNVNRVEVGERGVVVSFADGRFANPEGLIRLIQKNAGVITVRPEQRGGQSLIWHRRLGEGAQRLGGVALIVGELEKVAG